MRRALLTLTLVLAACAGTSRAKVKTLLDLNEQQMNIYADRANFDGKLYRAAQRAAPPDKQKFWLDALDAHETNTAAMIRVNRDLGRLALTLNVLTQEEQDALMDRIFEFAYKLEEK